MCILDQDTGSVFAGDNFGVAYPDLQTGTAPVVIPTSAPVQFDPEAAIASVGAIMGRAPRIVYTTHFGAVPDTALVAERLVEWLPFYADLGRASQDQPPEGRIDWLAARLREAYGERLAQVGLPSSHIARLEMDIHLNALGISVWAQRAGRDR
jgi:glyoxylase-like metal-dependent hydrolase (beta-lactamase superfamily II)